MKEFGMLVLSFVALAWSFSSLMEADGFGLLWWGVITGLMGMEVVRRLRAHTVNDR